MTAAEPCASHPQWQTLMVELARDGAEAINLDRCMHCGQFRLSWWWPKDSSDTALGSELQISADEADRLRSEPEWSSRAVLVRRIVERR